MKVGILVPMIRRRIVSFFFFFFFFQPSLVLSDHLFFVCFVNNRTKLEKHLYTTVHAGKQLTDISDLDTVTPCVMCPMCDVMCVCVLCVSV